MIQKKNRMIYSGKYTTFYTAYKSLPWTDSITSITKIITNTDFIISSEKADTPRTVQQSWLLEMYFSSWSRRRRKLHECIPIKIQLSSKCDYSPQIGKLFLTTWQNWNVSDYNWHSWERLITRYVVLQIISQYLGHITILTLKSLPIFAYPHVKVHIV